jgi:carbon-monoxide dehydrogenase large subunit/6-hydroxypseudooxynicotine dehydrogenase subunit gamma
MSTESTGRIGQSVERLEDPPLVTGRGQFAADISFPGQAHMRIVRSAVAHGEIVSIDVDAARAAPGIVAVWTSADIPEIPLIDFREGRIESLEAYRQPVLASGRVRYVGEPVAAIFAEDVYLAEDAADLVVVETRELPVVLDASATPVEFLPGHTTEAALLSQGYGDVEAAFAAAHEIVELDLSVGRHSGVPMETRGAIARYDAARDVLELHGAAKVPHRNREALSRMFGRDPSGVHVYESHVGGGFGIRGEMYPEDFLVCAAAMRLDRPVKWIEDRNEHLMAANQARDQRHRIRAAVDAEARITALDNEFFHDQGGYLRTHGTRVPTMTCGILPGPYRIPAYRATGHVRLTNKTPAATYRSPARYETTFARERLMDAIALRFGLDVLEVRRRNLITADEMPFGRPLEVLGDTVEYDTGDYPDLLDKTLDHVRWNDLEVEMAARRANGEMVGIGLAMFVEKSGLGPRDGVRVTVETTGAVEVVTGGSAVGQGFETAMAQICADTLGVDYRRVRVVKGRTDRIDHGIGAHASRATVMTGSATHEAALLVRAKAIRVAAEMLQTPADALDVIDGEVVRAGSDIGPSLGLGEIATSLLPTSRALGDHEPGLTAEGWHTTDHQTYPYGNHVAVVRVDRETGRVDLERYFMAYDIGRSVNPMMVEGQLHGGFAQGLGGALYEEFIYDDQGQPQSVTLADYLIPTMAEMPDLDVMVTEDAPSARNPLGIKGAGEAGITGVGAAVAAAIDDAIGRPGAITRLPVTPQRLKLILDGS